MGTLEVEGNTKEGALAQGLAQLGLKETDVEVETVKVGKGILDFLSRSPVRLRIHFKDEDLPPPPAAEPPPVSAPSGLADGLPLEEGSEGDGPTAAREALERLIGGMGFEATVEAQLLEGTAHLEIQSDSVSLLIGKRGETLDALEYLVERMVNRPPRPRLRVVVDAEGYRERAAEKIRDMARRLAERASETGEPAVCRPMNSRDRRIIHMALRDFEGVETSSQGEGAFRRVVISPNY
jgi:spoIIIJ-associated protein